MSVDTQIWTSIDYDKPGEADRLWACRNRTTRQVGNQFVPIAVINNGSGPTALLSGGNHGDEYEGPVALSKLACATLTRRRCRGASSSCLSSTHLPDKWVRAFHPLTVRI